MPASRTDERWFVSRLSDPGAKLRVLAGKPIGANRLVKEFDTPEEAEAAVREHNDRLNEKGPASAATDPDHGSTIPREETAMNRPNDTTTPVRPAMPAAGPSAQSVLAAFSEMEGSIGDARQMIEIAGSVIEDMPFDGANADTVVETVLLNRLVFIVYQTEKMLKAVQADWDRAYDVARGAA